MLGRGLQGPKPAQAAESGAASGHDAHSLGSDPNASRTSDAPRDDANAVERDHAANAGVTDDSGASRATRDEPGHDAGNDAGNDAGSDASSETAHAIESEETAPSDATEQDGDGADAADADQTEAAAEAAALAAQAVQPQAVQPQAVQPTKVEIMLASGAAESGAGSISGLSADAASGAQAGSAVIAAQTSGAPVAAATKDRAAATPAEPSQPAGQTRDDTTPAPQSSSAARATSQQDPRGDADAQQRDGRAPAQNPAMNGTVSAKAEAALEALANAARATSTTTVAAASGSAVAGRLGEVEAGIARGRVVDALDRGLLDLDATEAGDSLAASAQAQAASMATSQDDAQLGAGLSDGSSADPAADLARSNLDPRPTGQLAAKGLGILANQRGGSITMRLEPPALGQLRIELRISQGAVVADFTAATPEARVLLESNLGMLRERLESQGLSVERMTVHGAHGAETASVGGAAQPGDQRQDASGGGADARDRGDRSGGRQDAAGGESRGRREGGEQGRGRDARGERQEQTNFVGVLDSQQAKNDPRRLRKAV